MTLTWASLERSFSPAEVEYRWCQFWSKVMTSEVEERPRLVTAGYGRHRSQWVNRTTMSDKSSWHTFQKMTLFDTGAFVLFYLHLALILWYPLPPNSMLWRRGLCSQRNRKINTYLWGRGENETKTNFNTKCLNTCRPFVVSKQTILSVMEIIFPKQGFQQFC